MKTSPRRPFIARRVGFLRDSVIREMTALANTYGAINLAQGFPDFPAPKKVKEAAVRAIREDYNQYEITWGSAELRGEIARKLREINQIEADPETDISVMNGSTEALLATVLALTEQEDEVIILEPFYENYGPASIFSGARARYVRLNEPDFRLQEEDLKKAFNSRTKAIIINTPNNPTGRVLTRSELGVVRDLCKDYDCLAITDEIYEQIVYDGYEHISLGSLDGMWERSVTICGMSKTYSVTGWRLGYTVAEKTLSRAIRNVHDFITVCAPTPLQRAAIDALRLPASYYRQLVASYSKKRTFMLDSLREIGFDCVEPQGAYYIFADFRQLSAKDDAAFAEYLVREPRVAVVPGSSFYSTAGAGRSMVRFAYPKRDQTLREAVTRLKGSLTR